MNLQSALGQLTADSELCGRQRAQIARLKADAAAHASAVATLEAARATAEGAATTVGEECRALTRAMGALRDETIALKGENVRLRTALKECLDRLKRDASEDSMVDRRIVTKLVLTFFERKGSDQALQVMAGILGMTEDERQRMREYVKRGGVLGTVAKVPVAIVKAPLSMAGHAISEARVPENDSSLGELWVDFLTQGAEDDPASPIKRPR